MLLARFSMPFKMGTWMGSRGIFFKLHWVMNDNHLALFWYMFNAQKLFIIIMIILILLLLLILSYVSFLGQFPLAFFSSSFVFPCFFTWRVIYWILDIVNYMLLGLKVFCVLLNMFGFCSRLQLSYLETIWCFRCLL